MLALIEVLSKASWNLMEIVRKTSRIPRRSNSFVRILISDLQPIFAGMFTALEGVKGGERNVEVNEHRTIASVLHFHLIEVPTDGLDQFTLL
jgi:hypothetical protein